MNYFEIINKCLVELNYKQCDNFSDLIKNDHKKIKNIINIINAEVCGYDIWNFLLRKLDVELPKNSGEIFNTVEGRIRSIYIDNKKFEYFPDFEKFFLNKQPQQTYSAFNDKILLPIFNEDKNVEILYYSNKFAKDKDGNEKAYLTEATDESVIPYPFVEPILTYGTCMRLKGNTEYSKFSYWYQMYKEALSNLRAKIGTSAFEAPKINISRY